MAESSLEKKLAEALKGVKGVDKEALAEFNKELRKVEKNAKKTGDSVSYLRSDLSGLATAALSSRNALEKSREGTKAYNDTVNKTLDLLGDMIGVLPGLGPPLKGLLEAIQVLNKGAFTAADKISGYGEKLMKTFEGPLVPVRQLEQELFNVEKQFGGTLESAQAFSDEIFKMTAQAGREFFVTPEDLNAMRQGFARANISTDRFRGTIDTTLGSMDKLAFATIHASSVGLDMSKYADLTGRAMKDQGKSFEQAALQVQMFSDVAKNTGLSINSIADALGRGVAQFEKLGFASDFGRTFIEGFTRSLGDLGLGFEHALDLASSLTSAIAGISQDYGTAFVTMQKGNVDFGGGGGVLGAGIGFQAAMLEAEKTGDQSEIGNIMAGAMRDTIAGFTGGDIVTVSEAAEGGAGAQQQFFMQQKLLQDMYGLDQQSATRTLELLKNIDDAAASGDRDLVDSLNKQLDDEVKGRDKTLTEQEKANAQLSAISASNIVRNRLMLEQVALAAATGRGMVVGAEDAKQKLGMREYEVLVEKAGALVQAGEGIYDQTMKDILGVATKGDTPEESRTFEAALSGLGAPIDPKFRSPGAEETGRQTARAGEREKARFKEEVVEKGGKVEVTVRFKDPNMAKFFESSVQHERAHTTGVVKP